MNNDLKEIKCLIDGANVAHYPNRKVPTLSNVMKVFRQLQQQQFFGSQSVTILIVMKPVIRHYLQESEKGLFRHLERQGVLIQSFRGGGSADDQHILRLVEDFNQLGHEVWIVTNDSFQDHLDEFPWYYDFSHTIEYRIIDNLVQFNPPNAGEEKISILKGISQSQTEGEVSLKIIEIVDTSFKVKIDESVTLIDEPKDFFQLVRTTNVQEVFSINDQGTLRLWFMSQGKTYVHSIKGEFERINSLDEYLEALDAKTYTEEDYKLWKQAKLADKGWPDYFIYQIYLKSLLDYDIEQEIRSAATTNNRIEEQFFQQLQEIKNRVVANPIDNFPAYEHFCLPYTDWRLWLVAKENGWLSYSDLLDVWYNLIDFDMYVEKNRGFFIKLWMYLALKSPNDITHLTSREEFRRNYWYQYLGKPNSSETTDDPAFFLNQDKRELAKYRAVLRSANFDATTDIAEYCTIAQLYLHLKTKEMGWISYRDFLETARKLLSKEFWQQISNNWPWNRSTEKMAILEKLPASWHHSFLNGRKFIRSFLTYLASVSPQIVNELQLNVSDQNKVEVKLADQVLNILEIN
ncbi:MAG: hypothetical protein ACFFC7_02105 [Candidatus Hermodarchaeota archaeon]